jgi:hypothetical protein
MCGKIIKVPENRIGGQLLETKKQDEKMKHMIYFRYIWQYTDCKQF